MKISEKSLERANTILAILNATLQYHKFEDGFQLHPSDKDIEKVAKILDEARAEAVQEYDDEVFKEGFDYYDVCKSREQALAKLGAKGR